LILETLRLVKEEFSPRLAFNGVARLASFHRIQCSPGIRDAALYISSFLEEQGIQNELISYPAKRGVTWWSQESFPEWEARSAELVLLEGDKPKRLCSYAELKTSLIQRSAATPRDGLETKMVLVENGADPAAYEGIDVAGKLVFSRGVPADIAKIAVDKYGAVGVVVDTMREHPPVRDRFDLPDGRQYLSFWPADPKRHKAFGFVVSPRQGEALRKEFASGKKELAVFAKVDSRFFDGTMEVLSAVIPGCTNEEVVAIAHLCHPEASANDNASGSGTLMEAVRALNHLISRGRLRKPKRSIRFLWLPEMTGSYAYLASNEDSIDRTVAAINLDMVGENQDLCGSTFTVERPLSSLPGSGGDLAAFILGQVAREVKNLGGTHRYPTFRHTVGPFSGGSDHHIWGDASVGVTCPMLIQWPDKFYHTSEDTIDKVDPHMLWVAGVITATYLYTAANPTPLDAAVLAGEMATRFAGEVDGILTSVVEKAAEQAAKGGVTSDVVAKARRTIERRVSFLAARKLADVESLRRLVQQDSATFSEARSAAKETISVASKVLQAKALANLAAVAGQEDIPGLPPSWRPDATDAYERARTIVPHKIHRGPFSSMAKEFSPEYEEKAKAFASKYGEEARCANDIDRWADGTRNLLEIADLIEGDTGFVNIEALVDCFELMVLRGVFKPA
jgi:aminopeptidase YwaD